MQFVVGALLLISIKKQLLSLTLISFNVHQCEFVRLQRKYVVDVRAPIWNFKLGNNN